MSKKLKKEITTTVTNEDHFMSFYNENNKKLIVVDVYPGWSGPCTAMFPTYNQLMISIDDFEKRIDILLVNYYKSIFTLPHITLIYQLLQYYFVQKLDQDKLVNYKNDKFHATCQPKFLFIYEGKIIDEVVGTNIPVFIEKVNKYIPLSY
ncbi:hypothetical protein ABPG72_001285 [Tetrahymena utriculariae]